MHQNIKAAGQVLLLACSTPTLALDYRPLTSQELAAGEYWYDNVFIPEHVSITLVGEPKELTLRAREQLTLAGSLIGHGWQVRLEAQQINFTGMIDIAGGDVDLGGSITLLTPGRNIDIELSDRTYPRPSSATLVVGGNDPADLRIPAGGGVIQLNGPGTLNLAGDPGSHHPIVVLSPVPEPETWAMLLAGLGLVGLAARRRREV